MDIIQVIRPTDHLAYDWPTFCSQLDGLCLGLGTSQSEGLTVWLESYICHNINTFLYFHLCYRSQNVNVHINLETATSTGSSSRFSSAASSPELRPRLEMFSSTVRWMESLKWLFSGASRPIRCQY